MALLFVLGVGRAQGGSAGCPASPSAQTLGTRSLVRQPSDVLALWEPRQVVDCCVLVVCVQSSSAQ